MRTTAFIIHHFTLSFDNFVTIMRNACPLVFCLLSIFCFLSCSSDDDPNTDECKLLNLSKPLEYTLYKYNSFNRVESVTHFVDIDPAVDNIQYDVTGTITNVNRLRPNQTTYERHQIIYDPVTLKPKHLSSLGGDLNAPRRITNFYHDEKGRLIKIETPSGAGYVVFRYEYDDNDNIIRKFYTVPGGEEFLGRENHTFDEAPILYGDNPELRFIDTYAFLRPVSRNNVLTATIYANGAFARFVSPIDITYEYEYNDQGRVISGISSFEDLVGEFEYFDVVYRCD